jgi:hypothetical protein
MLVRTALFDKGAYDNCPTSAAPTLAPCGTA